MRSVLGWVLGWMLVVAPDAMAAVAQPLAAVQVLRQGNGVEPETLDPSRVESVSASNIVRDLYEGLTGNAPDGSVIPGAASSWVVSSDGRQYTFSLRPDARWSNGEAVVAEDFVAGMRRTVDPKTGSAYAQILAPLENATAVQSGKLPPERLGVVALDPQTLVIRLTQPTPYILGLLTHPSTFPIHRPSFAQWGKDFARAGRLVSNGAYVLAEWVVQSHIMLKRNPRYWNNAKTVIDTAYYYPTENINSELARYQADELDITNEIPLVQVPELRQQYPQQLRIAPYLGTYFYGYNVTKPPFVGNPKLRLALSLAVDREVIVQKVMNGVALPAYSFVPPGTWNYTPQDPEWKTWSREQRLSEARRLYKEAGYSAQNPAKVELRYNTHDDHKRIGVVVAAMWKQWLGVETTLINEEFKVFLQNRKLRKVTQVFRQAWIADYNDATSFIDILHSTHGQNDMGYNNPALDALIAKAVAEPDPAARRQLLQSAEALMIADAPIIPIYTYVSKHLVKPWVAGWVDNPTDYHYTKDLSILAH